MDEIWHARRLQLQKDLSLAVIALIEHTNTANFLAPLDPENGVFIAVGTKDTIVGMIQDIDDVSGANDNNGN
jgi:hypothetical protein